MADNRLNKTGLRYLLSKMVGFFALQSDLDTLQDEVDELITEGGEPNTIETVKVDGTALTPDANKAVDVLISRQYDLSDFTNTSNDPFVEESTMEAYVAEHGGVIQKVKRNGVELTIDSSDKSVNVLVPDTAATSSEDGLMSSTDKSKLDGIEAGAEANVQADWSQSASSADDFIKNKPTNLSDFTNDGDGTSGSTFPTTAQMNDAIDAKVVGALKPKGSCAFANLPALSAANVNTFYNVSDSFTTTADFIEGAGHAYPAGTNVAIINTGSDASPVYKYDAMTGEIDLSDYWNTTNLTALTTAEVDEVWDSVFNPTP